MLFYDVQERLFIMRNSWYGDGHKPAPKNKWTPHKLPNSWSKPPLPVDKLWNRGNALYNILFLVLRKKITRADRYWDIFSKRFSFIIWWGGENANTC